MKQVKIHPKKINNTSLSKNKKTENSLWQDEEPESANNTPFNYAESTSALTILNNILKKHGKDAPIRIKEGKYKHGRPGSFFKNIIFGNRYQRERKAASLHFRGNNGGNGEEISVTEAISLYDREKSRSNQSYVGMNASDTSSVKPTKLRAIPDHALMIGYHGTTKEGMNSLLTAGVKTNSTMRTGMDIKERDPVFYITDRWESALSYASGKENILEVWSLSPENLYHDAFTKANMQGVSELKVRGNFDLLYFKPAEHGNKLPKSFYKHGFDMPFLKK